ncbi:hypothetical protein ACPPVT_00705 [Angustibacter sp. McL0619]|uniref:hypothetical protein n=1 Tax=Angustibacter sp. McL0619 TaxID=3415676 RepID=UPI003CEABAB6
MTGIEKLRSWDGVAPAVALAVGLLVASLLSGDRVAVAVAVVGALTLACCIGVRLRTAALVAVLGWLLVTGFDVHRWGQLTPLSESDAVRLLVLALVAGAVALVSRPLLAHRTPPETREGGDGNALKSPPSLVSTRVR